MIKIFIEVKDGKVLDSLKSKETDLEECSLAVFRLEQIKSDLLKKEFESDFEVREDPEERGEDGEG